MPGQVIYMYIYKQRIIHCSLLFLVFNQSGFVFIQWEFQVGPAVGISAGDELWMARYILEVKLWFFVVVGTHFCPAYTDNDYIFTEDIRNCWSRCFLRS